MSPFGKTLYDRYLRERNLATNIQSTANILNAPTTNAINTDPYSNYINSDPYAALRATQDLGSLVKEPIIMLGMRMRWPVFNGPSVTHPFQHLAVVRDVESDSYILAIVHKGEVHKLVDSIHLFPSDTLIAKLRLLTE